MSVYVCSDVKVQQNSEGTWVIYASASAYAPVAELNADQIDYYCNISIYSGDELISSGNLKDWDPDASRITCADYSNYTYIGYGYMDLPSTGHDIRVSISIYYKMFQVYKRWASPNPYYYYNINF